MNRNYALTWSSVEQIFFNKRAALVKIDDLGIQNGMKLLEIGCGTGELARRIACMYPLTQITALDNAPKIIAYAQNLNKKETFSRLQFLCCDAHSLPFEDESFDICFFQTTLMHLSNPLKALRDLLRVTRKGGKIIAIGEGDWTHVVCHPACDGLEKAISGLIKKIRAGGGNPFIGRELKSLFEQIGLVNIETHTNQEVIYGIDLINQDYLAMATPFFPQSEAVKQWCANPNHFIKMADSVRATAQRPPTSMSIRMEIEDSIAHQSASNIIKKLKLHDKEKYDESFKNQIIFGQIMRSGLLPTILEKCPFYDLNTFSNIQRHDPYLWNRLPYILSFGYNLGHLPYRLVENECLQKSNQIGNAAALFNLIITLFDYFLDEVKQTLPLDAIVAFLTGNRQVALTQLQQLKPKDPRIQLFVAAIYMWNHYTDSIGKQLDRFIFELFQAELSTQSSAQCTASMIEKKSVGPSIAIGKMIIGLTQPTKEIAAKIQTFFQHLGKIFWLLDDISDIKKDFYNQSPNIILMRAGKSSDTTHLLAVVNQAIDEIYFHYHSIAQEMTTFKGAPHLKADLNDFINIAIYNWLIFKPEDFKSNEFER